MSKMKRQNADIVKLVGDLVEENERLDASLEAVFRTVVSLAKPGPRKKAKKIFGQDKTTVDAMKMLKSPKRKSSTTANAGRRAALEKARAALAAKRAAAKSTNTQKLGA